MIQADFSNFGIFAVTVVVGFIILGLINGKNEYDKKMAHKDKKEF